MGKRGAQVGAKYKPRVNDPRCSVMVRTESELRATQDAIKAVSNALEVLEANGFPLRLMRQVEPRRAILALRLVESSLCAVAFRYLCADAEPIENAM